MSTVIADYCAEPRRLDVIQEHTRVPVVRIQQVLYMRAAEKQSMLF
jgi:hypothetical protein